MCGCGDETCTEEHGDEIDEPRPEDSAGAALIVALFGAVQQARKQRGGRR